MFEPPIDHEPPGPSVSRRSFLKGAGVTLASYSLLTGPAAAATALPPASAQLAALHRRVVAALSQTTLSHYGISFEDRSSLVAGVLSVGGLPIAEPLLTLAPTAAEWSRLVALSDSRLLAEIRSRLAPTVTPQGATAQVALGDFAGDIEILIHALPGYDPVYQLTASAIFN